MTDTPKEPEPDPTVTRYDVVSDDGFEARYELKGDAAEHVKNLKAQAAGADWRGPKPTWRIEPVEVAATNSED